ncbi:DsbE family thiol:disulfide interchange protein [Enterobacter ludwigii]
MIPLILFLAIAAVLFWQFQRNAQGDDPSTLESALIGKPVPDIQHQALFDQGALYPAAIFASGKPVLLNIWATWCPTCATEQQFLNTLTAQGIQMIGLNFKDNRTKAQQWLVHSGDLYQYNLFDVKGIIRYFHAGELTSALWNKEIKPQWDKLSQGDLQ